MLNNQDARRNLSAVDRLLAAEKLREKIAQEAKLRQKEAGKEYGKGMDRLHPIGYNLSEEKEKPTTQKEIAKLAGVATGTVARFDKIMKSDDEELKEKVRSGEMSITTQQQIEEMTLNF